MSKRLRKRIKNLDLKSPRICKFISEHLDKFCLFLENEYHINSGGCCWTSCCLIELLQKTGFNVKLIINGIDSAQNIIDLTKPQTHYYVAITDYRDHVYYINDGGFGENDYEITFTLKDLKQHYKSNNWCCLYDHSKNKTIFNLLKTYYLDLLYDVC